MHIPFTRYGLREILLGSLLCALVAAVCFYLSPPVVLIPIAAWIFLLAFFRDPDRPGKADPDELFSPADGTVADIEEVDSPVFLEGRALRIGIFMSVFNVHVNRSPCNGEVQFTEHHPGAYHDARSDKCITDNEHNFVGLKRDDDRKILVNQISGMVARRIVCAVESGDQLVAGERFGMIKFGSRVELYIPMKHDPVASVKIGQNVKGGHDILATLGNHS